MKRIANHGLNIGINAIKDRKVETIKLTGVKLKIYSKMMDAIKCQITIKQVA